MPKFRKTVRPQVKPPKSAAKARRREIAAYRRGELNPPKPRITPRPQVPKAKKKLSFKAVQPHMLEISPASRAQLKRLAEKLNRKPK